jgi:Ca2+-binding RTX toxin-like protein
MATINGNSGNNTLGGTNVFDIIKGFGGNDTLNGLGGGDLLDGGTGDDTMNGGSGDDTYIVDSFGDVVTERTGFGRDTIRSSVTRTLGVNIENLTLMGGLALSGTGNASNNFMLGNEAANTLRGLDGDDNLWGAGGNDRLEGGAGADNLVGGAGADRMLGGAGFDTYQFTAGDVVTELAGGGRDKVISSVDHNLRVNFEDLELTGGAITGSGNNLVNVITGNGSNNTLRGFGDKDTLDGGAGSDRLFGGTGHDIFVVDSTGDRVFENAGEGTDLVRSSVTFNLGTTPHVEQLTLTGTANRSGFGNGLDNLINGNDGNNVLRGFGGIDTLFGNNGNDTLDGGTGNDQMTGGRGNDVYVVDSAGDQAFEFVGGGTDRIESFITFDLTTTPEVEDLTLLGTARLDGTGNARDNVIRGNVESNQLNGGGGNDVLIGGRGQDGLDGGPGADVYRFVTLADSFISSPILFSDFLTFSQADGDRIDLSAIDADVTNDAAINDTFTFVGTGALGTFTPGRVRYEHTTFGGSPVTRVQVNVDLLDDPEFELILLGHLTMTASDFNL